jgi:hypothetical protein
MKQIKRIKGVNFNYDLPDYVYVVGLDKSDVPEIQRLKVVGITKDKLLKLDSKIAVKPIAKMHWDAVCKNQGKKTIPYKSISQDPIRGYVFTRERYAIQKISYIKSKLVSEAQALTEKAASVAARHDNYLMVYLMKCKENGVDVLTGKPPRL